MTVPVPSVVKSARGVDSIDVGRVFSRTAEHISLHARRGSRERAASLLLSLSYLERWNHWQQKDMTGTFDDIHHISS